MGNRIRSEYVVTHGLSTSSHAFADIRMYGRWTRPLFCKIDRERDVGHHLPRVRLYGGGECQVCIDSTRGAQSRKWQPSLCGRTPLPQSCCCRSSLLFRRGVPVCMSICPRWALGEMSPMAPWWRTRAPSRRDIAPQCACALVDLRSRTLCRREGVEEDSGDAQHTLPGS